MVIMMMVMMLINGDASDGSGGDDGKGDGNDAINHRWWCVGCCSRQKALGEIASAPFFRLQEKFFMPLSLHAAIQTTN